MFAGLKTVRDRAGFRCVRIGWKAEGCRGPDAEAVAGAIDSVGVVGGGDEKSTVSFGSMLYYDFQLSQIPKYSHYDVLLHHLNIKHWQ